MGTCVYMCILTCWWLNWHPHTYWLDVTYEAYQRISQPLDNKDFILTPTHLNRWGKHSTIYKGVILQENIMTPTAVGNIMLVHDKPEVFWKWQECNNLTRSCIKIPSKNRQTMTLRHSLQLLYLLEVSFSLHRPAPFIDRPKRIVLTREDCGRKTEVKVYQFQWNRLKTGRADHQLWGTLG